MHVAGSQTLLKFFSLMFLGLGSMWFLPRGLKTVIDIYSNDLLFCNVIGKHTWEHSAPAHCEALVLL
jgi:hypothetical protein